MTSEVRQLADPQTLARISRLELRARAVVEGVISGMHRSPHRGSSVEFAQHRDYVPGDEIRHIDWKVYARSDRYHIKQYEEETTSRRRWSWTPVQAWTTKARRRTSPSANTRRSWPPPSPRCCFGSEMPWASPPSTRGCASLFRPPPPA